MNSINIHALHKMEEIKRNYENKKYKYSGGDFLSGNFGSIIYLSKDCKKYFYRIAIEYNVNISIDDIVVRIEKHSKNIFDVETKKYYIPIAPEKN